MTAAVQALLALIEALLPQIGVNSAIVDTILKGLIQVLPIVVQEAEDLVPAVKNIIAALSANPATTADQLATLQALDKQADGDFEAAATAAGYPTPSTGDAA